MRLLLLTFGAACGWLMLSASWARADVLAPANPISEERLERLFRPLAGLRVAMSTDGHYLAYTQHVGSDLQIVVYDLERLRVQARIIADDDRPIMFSKEKKKTELRFLGWANGRRLVFAPEIEVVEPPVRIPSGEVLAGMSQEVRDMIRAIPKLQKRYIAPVQAVDADGGHPTNLLEQSDFAALADRSSPEGDRRAIVPSLRGFGTGRLRDQLRVELPSFAAGDPTQLYGFNVESGAFKSLSEAFGTGRFIYDRQGQPRLKSLTNARQATTVFEYLAPGGKKWAPMPAPAEADAGTSFTLAPESYFSPRVIPLGFDFDPNVLLYASNAGQDAFGIYGLDLRTRKRTAPALTVPHRDLVDLDTTIESSPLVIDPFRERIVGVRTTFGPRPFSLWLDPEFVEIQRAVERRFPGRTVRIEEWNEARTRFLVRTSGGTHPGSLLILRRPEGTMTELTRSAPWLDEGTLHVTQFFEFTAPNGAQLTGHLTLPRAPRLNPPPLIVWFAPGLPPRPHPEFDPQAQVFADMGFVVCRLNQRGVAGLGAEDREALRRNFDRAPAEDAMAAIEWIAQRHRIDRKRVATFGADIGAHFALRATQLYPEAFRCAIVFAPTVHFWPLVQLPPNVDGQEIRTFAQRTTLRYLQDSGLRIDELPTTAHPEAWSVAVFIATSMTQNPEQAAGVAELRAQLGRRDLPAVQIEYQSDFTHARPAARARVYRALEEFINLNLYQYDVKVGPTRVVK